MTAAGGSAPSGARPDPAPDPARPDSARSGPAGPGPASPTPASHGAAGRGQDRASQDRASQDRASEDKATAARTRMAGALRVSGRVPSPAVQAAFLAVPRHLFVPGLDPAAAYQDEALVIKYGADGLPVSSSSQPAMMAIMLEQLGLRPGHRVLEVGTGTGYNAAVMAHIVGPGGQVVTMDIDAELVARAQDSLTAAGYDAVLARCGDGGFGAPEDAPFDRVIVTAGAWDIAPAWLDQLAAGGRLVLPLAVRAIQLSVGLERQGDGECWTAASAFRCGFVRMAGAFAGPEAFRPVGPSGGMYVQADDGHMVDTRALAAALDGPAVDVSAGVRIASREELGDVDLWLTLTEPGLDRLTLMETGSVRGRAGPLLPFGGLASRVGERGQLGVSGLAGSWLAGPEPPDEIVLRGYGRGGPALASHLAARALAWDSLGRPGTADLCLTVCPPGARLPVAAGQIVLSRPHIRLAAGWPVR
jgi:protein-L-isoaspartate(D-aspartate) O-methyltransferase